MGELPLARCRNHLCLPCLLVVQRVLVAIVEPRRALQVCGPCALHDLARDRLAGADVGEEVGAKGPRLALVRQQQVLVADNDVIGLAAVDLERVDVFDAVPHGAAAGQLRDRPQLVDHNNVKLDADELVQTFEAAQDLVMTIYATSASAVLSLILAMRKTIADLLGHPNCEQQ